MKSFQPLFRAVALVGVLALSAAGAHAAPPEHGVPRGLPVQLDGRVNAAEWGEALSIPLGTTGTHLRIQQHRGMLLLALDSPLPWPLRGNLTLLFSPEGATSGMRAPGFVRIDYEPMRHDRPHLIVRRMTPEGSTRVHDAVVARRAFTEHTAGIEIAFRLDLLGLTKEDRGPRRLAVHWVRPYSRNHIIWPGGLDFVGKPRQMPPDLATAERWATLKDWGDPTGPGAFPKAEWTKFIEHDRELTRRGQEAHAEMRLLREEWKKTKKRDGELTKLVIDNFDWIAKREALTAEDLIEQATLLRYLNRCEEAVGILSAIANHPERSAGQAALFENALTYESMGLFARASRTWERLAARLGEPHQTVYRQRAERAMGKVGGREAELRARAEDAVRDDLPLVELQTDRGPVVLELYKHDVPKAVEHFLNLVESKFYDGTLFHRVHGDFMAQGGDAKSRDQGCDFAGSGTSPNEIPMERNPRRHFWRGALGFARGMRPMNGSQFFIMTSPKPEMSDPEADDEDVYTCFGRVRSGMHAVDRIEFCDKLIKAVVLRR